ncbi:MAG: GGDEF domain-containing protein [Butyrivibrio sp.]|nr:GGDEF domain-containing protein [Butyrivibrio sp.]
MNIGLLISELVSDRERDICIGADIAAREKNVNLTILPGKYIITDDNEDNFEKYEYQHQAIFEYINSDCFDVLIVDIEEIGKYSPILKKNAFLKSFEKIPIITITGYEEYNFVPCVDEEDFKQIGYESVYDAVSLIEYGKIPLPREQRNFEYENINENDAQEVITKISQILADREYDPNEAYRNILKRMGKAGIKNSMILLYTESTKKIFKRKWIKPDKITVKASEKDGIIFSDEKELIIDTDSIFKYMNKNERKTVLARVLFYKEKQLGLFVSEMVPVYLKKGFTDQLLNIITGVLRIIYLEYNFQKVTEELLVVQEELEKDDSVLDHIGEKDYLTGKLNRRGFFSEAYDLLRRNFKEGSSVIVAYIDMDSLKNINQLFGHDEGDVAVKKVAAILEDVFGKDSIVGRIRGDEFAVIQVREDEGMAEQFKLKMVEQNARLMNASAKYLNHLQFSICEFDYDENLSLREMLKETDDNLKKMKKLDFNK